METVELTAEERCAEIHQDGMKIMTGRYQAPSNGLAFVEVIDQKWRKLYDEALDLVHYSHSCQRVGRCMRLAIVADGEWVGGIVLGSTFPNILVRDNAVGLRQFVLGYRERGLSNPWSRQNRLYWGNLQKVVNHARTFVFPQFQGRGLAISAHAELLKSGVEMWGRKYNEEVYALDTLCTADESKLFLRNGWTLVGYTKGFSADKGKLLSKAVGSKEDSKNGIKNNVGLTLGSTQWCVWIIKLKEFQVLYQLAKEML